MTSFTFFSGVGASQFLVDNETGYLGTNAAIDGQIDGAGSQIDLRIHGTVVAGVAVDLRGSNNTLFIGRTGIVEGLSNSVTGSAAVEFSLEPNTANDVGRFFNEGQIHGNVMAAYLATGGTDDRITLTNSGTMVGEVSGVHLFGQGTALISNSGLIEGFTNGVSNISASFFGTQVTMQLTNSGVIRAPAFAVHSGDMADRVLNRGILDGDVSLNGGSDMLDNFGGTITGEIFLGDGADTLILGAGIEIADGGIGATDLVDARAGLGGVIDLVEDRGTGLALGDILTGFERVRGSASGADTIYGNASANLFLGYGGADALHGGDGSDLLYGGRGIDLLEGGADNDTFGFFNLTEIGDTITDFSANAAGNNDRFYIFASGFGGGLAAGTLSSALFVNRADNVAQDANDRFIFRSTDRSLWFDVDGNGAAAAVMVADLQSGATMTEIDIFVV